MALETPWIPNYLTLNLLSLLEVQYNKWNHKCLAGGEKDNCTAAQKTFRVSDRQEAARQTEVYSSLTPTKDDNREAESIVLLFALNNQRSDPTITIEISCHTLVNSALPLSSDEGLWFRVSLHVCVCVCVCTLCHPFWHSSTGQQQCFSYHLIPILYFRRNQRHSSPSWNPNTVDWLQILRETLKCFISMCAVSWRCRTYCMLILIIVGRSLQGSGYKLTVSFK